MWEEKKLLPGRRKMTTRNIVEKQQGGGLFALGMDRIGCGEKDASLYVKGEKKKGRENIITEPEKKGGRAFDLFF